MPISRVEVHPSCGRNLKGPPFMATACDGSGKGYVRSGRKLPIRSGCQTLVAALLIQCR